VINTIMAASALIISVMTIATVLYNSATRMAKLEVKVETMWAFQMRRGAAEAVSNQIATINSPLSFRADALEALSPMKERLTLFAQEHNGISEVEFFWMLERAFGDELVKRFCIPFNVSQGACLLAAMQVATNAPVPIEPYRKVKI
ncbi:MAG: hypothetical protein WAK11_08770, partial [Candidatus Cybelea sp.]